LIDLAFVLLSSLFIFSFLLIDNEHLSIISLILSKSSVENVKAFGNELAISFSFAVISHAMAIGR